MLDYFQYAMVKLFSFLHIENPFIQQFIIALIFAYFFVDFAKELTNPKLLFPGVIVHELSHAFFAKIFGFKITKIKSLNFLLKRKKKREKQSEKDNRDNWDNAENIKIKENGFNKKIKNDNDKDSKYNKESRHINTTGYFELHPTRDVSLIGAFFTFFSPLIFGVIAAYYEIILAEFYFIPAAVYSSNTASTFLYLIIYFIIFYFLLTIIAGSEISKADLIGFINAVKTKPSLIKEDVGTIVLTLFLTPICLNFFELKIPGFFGLISNFYFINLIFFFILLIVIYFVHHIIVKIATVLINLGRRIKKKIEIFIADTKFRLKKSSERFFRKIKLELGDKPIKIITDENYFKQMSKDRELKGKFLGMNADGNNFFNEKDDKRNNFEFLEKFKRNLEDLDRLTKN